MGEDTAAMTRPAGESRQLNITPHVAQHTKRASSIDGRTTRHEGYTISLKKRKRVEQIFGWLEDDGRDAEIGVTGDGSGAVMFTLSLSVYNIMVRMRTIALQAAKA